MRASEQPHGPQGLVALVLIDVSVAPGSEHLGDRVLQAAIARLASLFNRRLRAVDLLARTGDNELAVLLTHAHIGVAAAFSERLRQPIEQALRQVDLASDIIVCMGLAANPPATDWHPDALIDLSDFRARAAKQRARASSPREWALTVDGESMLPDWSDSLPWPATGYITGDMGL